MEHDINWPLSSVVYHCYVRSFQDSNADGIGDLKGLTSRLDYLKDLGISAIWLSPIYPSPQKDFGYDVADYTDVDLIYGTLNEFDEFVRLAHEKKIRVMIDYVPNHTSSQHRWFQESSESSDNPKRDWYIWADGKNGTPPNNWLSVFGGSGWQWDEKTNSYYLHTFDVYQPDLNWRNPEVQQAMLDVLRFWMDRGVDGFRVDVPYHMFKNPTFENEPQNPNFVQGSHGPYDSLLHVHTSWLPESYDMMKQFADVLKEHDGKFMVTEAWGNSLQDLIKLYITVGWKFYQPFNFSLITLPWKADVHKQYIDEYDKALGDLYIPCWVLGNHDTKRVASRIGEKQARIAAMLQLTLRGLPFIYYGEELGMINGQIPPEKVQDIFEKNSPGLGLGRDPQRTPMQWNSLKNSGFTNGKPWLPVNSDYTKKNVENEKSDEKSMFSLYRKLINTEKESIPLKEGVYTPLTLPANNVFAFLREKNNEKILILLNFDNKDKLINMEYKEATVLLNASLTVHTGDVINLTEFILKGDEGYIFRL